MRRLSTAFFISVMGFGAFISSLSLVTLFETMQTSTGLSLSILISFVGLGVAIMLITFGCIGLILEDIRRYSSTKSKQAQKQSQPTSNMENGP